MLQHSTDLFVTAMSSEMSITAWQKYEFKPYHPDSIVLGKSEIFRHIISFLSKPLKFENAFVSRSQLINLAEDL